MKKIVLTLIVISQMLLLAGATSIQNKKFQNTQAMVNHEQVTDASLECMRLIQSLTKKYLYRGIGMSSKSLDIEITENIVSLNRLMQKFDAYLTEDDKVQRNLKMIKIAEKEFEGTVIGYYSSDNMQILMDLTSVISESITGILKATSMGIVIYKKDSNSRMLRLSSL